MGRLSQRLQPPSAYAAALRAGPGPYDARQSNQSALAQSMALQDAPIVDRMTFLPFGKDALGQNRLAWPSAVTSFAQSAMMPGDLLMGKQFTNDQMEAAALDLVGTGMGAGFVLTPKGALGSGAVRQGAGAAGDVAQGIRAYHGSPHTFDQFDMSKFGTGEGGGAYGHGLYFAESEDAARTYRDALSAGQPGSMYQVRINAKADDFLDWDKPLSEQSDVVQGWFEKYRRKLTEQNNGNYPYRYYVPEGKDIIDDVKDLMDDGKINLNDLEEMLSMDAKGAGIAGIRYLDANSRPLSAPTSIGLPETNNYVVFDDKLIEILRRYGLIPPVAAGLGLAATGNNAEAGQ